MTRATERGLRLVAAGVLAVVVAAGLALSPPPPPVRPATGMAGLPAEALHLTAPTSTPAAVTGPVITTQPAHAVVGRYGIRTTAKLFVRAEGSKLRYRWQSQAPDGGAWQTIRGAKAARYVARAASWADGTRFRVVVTGAGGRVISAAVRLTVLRPTRTPARDAEAAFGLTGLTQGVDLSAYQYTPSKKVNLKSVAAWAGPGGFAILRNGSGARPIRQKYLSACTNRGGRTGSRPVVEDCAYRILADRAQAAGLQLGHYWFNGWISTIDTTSRQLFAGGYTPEDSARQFVRWLLADGNYTRASTAPLVLDVEAGHAWKRTYKGKTYTRTLRAWDQFEAARYLTTVRDLLTRDGYQANLYVYLNANAASRTVPGGYKWSGVAGIARLWVASWGTNNGRIPDALPRVGPWANWSIWQYTSNANVAGIGAIDGDLATADAWTPLPVP